jgi:hypothetical protein
VCILGLILVGGIMTTFIYLLFFAPANEDELSQLQPYCYETLTWQIADAINKADVMNEPDQIMVSALQYTIKDSSGNLLDSPVTSDGEDVGPKTESFY